ncbi:extracellular solute-binding protein, partial [Streptomyces sp. NPDC058272]|uniref:extracellular solute-binding protein n=1 Tax=Streptomyces sp. NPDC058272 TaxID=3346415 RepID=UPI0036EDCE7C
MRHRLLAVVCVTASLLTACGVLPEGGAERRTVTVWLMKDSASKEFLKRFTEDFERTHGDLRLDIRIQEWTGIGEKVQAALKQGDKSGPDVIEVGNTQVAQYVEGGGLSDLTLESMRDWGMNDWLPGLAEPGRIGARQFGIPWYAANRVVIYRKDLFAQAGIDGPPKTRDQWIADTARLNSAGIQGIYLAGQDWYTLAGFIWDEGGDLAEKSSAGNWKGTLQTPAALRGMDFYRRLQALGDGPADGDDDL